MSTDELYSKRRPDGLVVWVDRGTEVTFPYSERSDKRFVSECTVCNLLIAYGAEGRHERTQGHKRGMAALAEKRARAMKLGL